MDRPPAKSTKSATSDTGWQRFEASGKLGKK